MTRWGLTVPLSGIPNVDHPAVMREAEELGYTDAWSLEVDGTDAFSPLAATALGTERMRVGTAIASAFTRGPATLAMSALGMAELAPGRFVLGIGSASDTIVRDWNGGQFVKPLARTRDVMELVREALAGGRVARSLDAASMQGFRFSRPLPAPVPLYLAALRGGMLQLAGERADGVIINWLTVADVSGVVQVARKAATAAGRDAASLEVACRIFVTVSDDLEAARQFARRYIAGYLNVPVYREFHKWLGNEGLLGGMWERWDTGDRRGALAALSDEAVDRLYAVGNADRCREAIEAYVAGGVETPILCFLPMSPDWGTQREESLAMMRALAPR